MGLYTDSSLPTSLLRECGGRLFPGSPPGTGSNDCLVELAQLLPYSRELLIHRRRLGALELPEACSRSDRKSELLEVGVGEMRHVLHANLPLKHHKNTVKIQ